jgi:hypothetical protein
MWLPYTTCVIVLTNKKTEYNVDAYKPLTVHNITELKTLWLNVYLSYHAKTKYYFATHRLHLQTDKYQPLLLKMQRTLLASMLYDLQTVRYL